MKTFKTMALFALTLTTIILVGIPAAITLFITLLVFNGIYKGFKKMIFGNRRGILTKDEYKFLKSKGLKSNQYFDLNSKNYRDYKTSQKLNDAQYLQTLIEVKNKMQSELSVTIDILKNFKGIEIDVSPEIMNDKVAFKEEYKNYSKKVKGKNSLEKILSSNKIKHKSRTSKIPFYTSVLATTLSLIALPFYSIVALPITLVLMSVVMYKQSKIKKSLSKKQINSLKNLSLNLIRKIEVANDEIVGFVRRERQIVSALGETSISKLHKFQFAMIEAKGVQQKLMLNA